MVPEMPAGGVGDESARGQVQVGEGGAVLTQAVGSSVCDLVAVRQHQAANQLAVLGKRPEENTEEKLKKIKIITKIIRLTVNKLLISCDIMAFFSLQVPVH